ncbi:unnamed protein product [Caenorhabditis nigoni]
MSSRQEPDFLALFYMCFTFNVISALLYIFVHKHIGEYRMKYRGGFCRTLSMFIGILVPVLILALGISIEEGYKNPYAIRIFQFYYSFFTASFLDFMVGIGGGLKVYYRSSYIDIPRRNYNLLHLVRRVRSFA